MFCLSVRRFYTFSQPFLPLCPSLLGSSALNQGKNKKKKPGTNLSKELTLKWSGPGKKSSPTTLSACGFMAQTSLHKHTKCLFFFYAVEG
jgi:hypothetical protein